MENGGYTIAGELAEWPSKRRMASLLRNAGFRVNLGAYSIRLDDCSLSFQEYGGDLGEPQVEADADTLDELLRDAQRVSDALAQAGVRHRFEIYKRRLNDLIKYFHHNWPLGADG